jgi:hypothetical protein
MSDSSGYTTGCTHVPSYLYPLKLMQRLTRNSLLILLLAQSMLSFQGLNAERSGGMSAKWAYGVMAHVPGVGEEPGGELSVRFGSPMARDLHSLGFYGRIAGGIADGNGEGFGSGGLAYYSAQTGTTLEGGGLAGFFDGRRFGAGGEGGLFQQLFQGNAEVGGVARILAESGGAEKEVLIGVRFRFE